MKRLVAGAAVACAMLTIATSGLGAVRTTATVFKAFTSSGAPTIPTRTKSGHCYTGSLTINRSDAWRCFVGNFIYDPCFSSSAAPGVVVCPNREVNRGTEIRLTRKLPKKFADHGSPSLRHQPWDIELVGGRHCVYSSGASNEVHGIRLNYFCGAHTKDGLWGRPNRRVEPWTIRIAPFNTKRLVRRAAIRHVWM